MNLLKHQKTLVVDNIKGINILEYTGPTSVCVIENGVTKYE